MAIKQDIKLTVDTVIFSFDSLVRRVLLVKRKNEPYKGKWVIPGGFVEDGENLETAAIRELEEETGLKIETLRQIQAYGKPNRDPRGHTVTIAFLAQVNAQDVVIKAASDAEDVEWFDLNFLPQLGFDHSEIIRDALKLYEREN